MDNTTLSHNIKHLRKHRKISQEKLASSLGISRSNIAAYESKNVEPRLGTVLKIARLFDINIRTLLEKKLESGEDFPSYESNSYDPNPEDGESLVIQNDEDIEIFISKSIKIKKILEGFKVFYTFKRNNVKDKSFENSKIIYDIDNFIKLMEHLLTYNETIIKALSNKKTVDG